MSCLVWRSWWFVLLVTLGWGVLVPLLGAILSFLLWCGQWFAWDGEGRNIATSFNDFDLGASFKL